MPQRKTVYSVSQVRQRAVEACLSGMPVSEVAKAFGASRATVYRWLGRYQDQGIAGISRKHSPGSGRPRKLAELDEPTLLNMISTGPASFGYTSDLWTSSRIKAVVEKEFGVRVSQRTIRRRLRESGLSYQMPEKQFFEVDPEVRTKWRRYQLPRIRRCVALNRAILYFQDEAHVAMATVLGKTWAPVGETPTVRSSGKRGGVSALSSVSERGDLVFQVTKKRIASPQVISFLKQMLRHHPRRHLVVVMDQARPHVSKMTRDFVNGAKRLHVFYLPPYSPDWNPDEKIWNYLKNVELMNRNFRDKGDLQKQTRNGLNRMRYSPRKVRGIFYRSAVANFLS